MEVSAAVEIPQLPQTENLDDVGREAPADGAGTARPPPKKRRRIVISCTECHRRKQKCDRGYPCTNCVSRNKQDACRYETGAPTARERQQKVETLSHRSGSGSPSKPAADGGGGPGSELGAVQAAGGGARDGDGRADGGGSSRPPTGTNFGYAPSGASTLGFLKRIDSATGSGEAQDQRPGLARLAAEGAPQSDTLGTRERFKSLLRQLPARTYIAQLVEVYFKEFNFAYFPLEPGHFAQQLAEWDGQPFSLLSTAGPHGLAPEMRAFPALLFQVLATALLVLPPGPHPSFEPLKYARGMTFEDLATDYSESGVAILALLGKRQMSLNTVLAGFLRVAFLKYTALITESWHAIGNTVRDAQEIGLHREALDPRPPPDADAAAVLRNQWEIQHRRRIWHTLVIWDLHTGVVLGRPVAIDGELLPPLPVDCPVPQDRSREPVRPRGEGDPPTPITRLLWMFRCMQVLRDVHRLEKEGPCPRNFARVDQLHDRLLALDEDTPTVFRMENPDTSFDQHPDCYWLPAVRPILPQQVAFNFMVLHRPYVFTRPKSRTEALKACLTILQSQRVQFQEMRPEQYKTFSVFFGTFDAIVLLATIYIFFPKEHPDLVHDALQHFQWSVERFEAMSARNNLAKAAVGVLQAIYIRLKKSLGFGFVCAGGSSKCVVPPVDPPGAASETTSTSVTSSAEPQAPAAAPPQQQQLSPPSSAGTPFLQVVTNNPPAPPTLGSSSTTTTSFGGGGSSMTPGTSTTAGSDGYPASAPTPQQALDWSLPSDFDWSSIQPLYATGDLVYNDLDAAAGGNGGAAELQTWPSSGFGDIASAAPVAPMRGARATDDGGDPASQGNLTWHFEGDFGNDSVWSVLNYAPF